MHVVFLEFEGVLADTTPHRVAALRDALLADGLALDDDTWIEHCLGLTVDDAVVAARRALGAADDPVAAEVTRLRAERGFVERIGRGLFSTFNANWPLIRFPVDHAFVSRHFEVAAFEVLPHVGSDHFPVFARLALTKVATAVNEEPTPATVSDESEAEQKIARAAPGATDQAGASARQ